MTEATAVKNNLDLHAQGHLYKYLDNLSCRKHEKYLKELATLNFDRINSAYELAEGTQTVDDRLSSPDSSICTHVNSLRDSYPNEYFACIEKGLIAISEGKVAVVLLAGGQGTRLGFSEPKGMYDIGLPSKRTLFQIQAERLLNLCRQVSAKFGQRIYIPWYIMTSDQTHQATENFFKEHDYFGYSSDHVIFFQQFNIPVLSPKGKILMKDKGSICWSPEGNGGLYRALSERGILLRMKKEGTQYVHIYGVDNVLVQMADPAFIGYCIVKGADCGIKVVEKVDPNESIGIVGVVDGKFRVVEYSEISPSTAALTSPVLPCRLGHSTDEMDGRLISFKPRLVYCLGNICSHFMTLGFLEYVCDPKQESLLPYHLAHKKVPHLDIDSGRLITPTQPNALKLEKFVFDVLQFSRHFFIWEVDRATEFAPLKNGSGALRDCPKTCRQSILRNHILWAKAAGAVFNNEKEDIIEISPLVSLEGENLECLEGKKIAGVNILELRPNEEGKTAPTLLKIPDPSLPL